MKADPKQIPTRSSSPEEWVQWHKALKSSYGKPVANQLFLKAWGLRGNNNDDHNLRKYLESQGIKIGKSISEMIIDKSYGVVDTIGGIMNVGKYATYAIGGIVILGSALLIYNIAKNPIGSANTALKIRTGGV